ncbi:MAG: hypothetical protein LBT12_01175 [Oscillospiraceae bacterium]|jgi:hypothetical protein|nr:hypothetical protein [Oscillospiraceae bacterium]
MNSDFNDSARTEALLTYALPYSEENSENIKNRFLQKTATRRRPARTARRAILAAAIAVLCFALSGAAVAALLGFDLGTFYNSLFNNPAVAERIAVGETVTDSGIEVTLVSVYAEEHATYFLLSLRDLEGGRLSDSIAIATDPNGYYSFSVDTVDCNDAGTAATVALESQSPWLPQHLEQIEKGGQLSLAITAILSDIQQCDAEKLNFDLAARLRDDAPITQEEWLAGQSWSGGNYFLVPGNETISDPFVSGNLLPRGEDTIAVEGMTSAEVSNLGFVNGRLHIQFKRTHEVFISNFGDPVLVDRDGTALQPFYSISAGGYTEYFFDVVGEENLESYTLAFTGSRAARVIAGSWSLRFDAPSPPETRELAVSVGELLYPRPSTPGETKITIEQLRFVVSPMSTKLYTSFAPGKEAHTGLNTNGMFLTLTDGREIPLVLRGNSEDQQNPENSYNFYIHEYVDPDRVSSVTLWDVAYPFNS